MTRRRRLRALGLLLIAAAVVASPATAAGSVAWTQPPRLLPGGSARAGFVLHGRIVNFSAEPVELRAAKLSLRDPDGRRIPGSVLFLAAFVRSLEPYNRGPVELPANELARLGRTVALAPGAVAPLTLAWRGTRWPSQVRTPAGPLAVPGRRPSTRGR